MTESASESDGGTVRINSPVSRADPRAPAVVLLGLAGIAGLAWLARRMPPLSVSAGASAGTVRGVRRKLAPAAALLGVSVLADSGLEHYRGSFKNPAMFAPLAVASLSVLANTQGAIAGDRGRGWRDAVHLTSGAVGLAGLGFHVYNIGKRPGGYGWLNLFYAAPFGAPAALTLAGLIGGATERLEPARPAGEQRLAGLPFGRSVAGLTAAGIIGTVAEASLLHFRGAFHSPFMWLPVSLPPVAGALLLKAALAPARGALWASRGWLWMTALLGLAGVGFHAFGIARNMGGWRNWRQNILAGPPLPAPPAFSALALAGVAALDLIEASGSAGRSGGGHVG